MRHQRLVTAFWNRDYDLTTAYPLLDILPAALHPVPVAKYRRVYEACRHLPLKMNHARRITRQELLLAHDEIFIDDVFSLAAAGLIRSAAAVYLGTTSIIDSDCLPLNSSILNMHLAACGGTLQAARQAADRGGISINLHGGFHHAYRDRGAGFCLVNDLSIAAVWLANQRKKVLVVDADVHAGDGTASIVNGLGRRLRNRIQTLSIHMKNGYPDDRPPNDYQHEFRKGTRDRQFLRAFRRLLTHALDALSPDVVIYQAGVDALVSDRLGMLSLSLGGLKRRDRVLFDECKRRRIAVAVVLGGGYSDTETTAAAHVNTIRSAIESADN